MPEDWTLTQRTDTVGAAPPGWYADGRGATRWWDGQGWTGHVVAPAPAPYAAAIPPAPVSDRGSRVGWWVLGGGATVAVVLVVAVFALGFGNLLDAPSGTPGYSTFYGPAGLPMQKGSPWGQPCAPVVISVEDSVPPAVHEEVVAVVGEARAAGLNIDVWSSQYPEGASPLDEPPQGPPHVVGVYVDTQVPPLRPDGSPSRDDTRWDARPSPDGRHEILTSLGQSLHLATLGEDRLEYRRSLRKLVGRTQGIADSSHRGSALRSRDPSKPDAFSPQDIQAMLVMSGCAGA